MSPGDRSYAARAAGHARAAAERSDWRSPLARSGLVAKGVLYAAVGILAIQVARGSAASEAASKRGAIELVASQPLGQWLLVLLTAGLFALAAWQVILAFTGDPVEGSEASDRAKFAGKAAIYLGTAITSLNVLLANWGTDGGRAATTGGGAGASEGQAAATIMTWPGGQWIVALIGCGIIAAAIYQLYRHAAQKQFMQRLARAQMSHKVESGVERAGRAGYAARGIVLAVVGVFFLVAAIQHDPQEAVGLSGALRVLAQQTWGQFLLWFVAIGLTLFGGFCFAEAKYRRAT